MTTQPDQLQELAGLLAKVQAQQPSGWQQATSAPAECLGVAVPIKLDTPAGQIRLYLNFPGSAAATPAALLALLEQLAAAGLPLDTWESKSAGWGQRDGNGWNGNRSGYGRRDNWRR